MDASIFQDYFYHRFTLKDLSKKYSHSREWIQERIHHYTPEIKSREPRASTCVIDATFFGKRRDKFGVLVAKDVLRKEPIAYNFIESETKEAYRNLLLQINDRGFQLHAVVLDGKPGIFSLFEGIPMSSAELN